MSLGRNDPCPCGSGKKYKKCCLLKDEEASHEREQDPAEAAADPRSEKDREAAKREPDPVVKAREARWQEFQAADYEKQLALFSRTLDDPELMDGEMAFEMLSEIFLAAAERGDRDRFDVLVQSLAERRPDVYAEEKPFFLKWRITNALAAGRPEDVATLTLEMAPLACKDIDIFNRVEERVAYHGYLTPLVGAMRLAWPGVQSSSDIVPWGIDEFCTRATTYEILNYASSISEPDADDPALAGRLEFFSEIDAGRVASYLADVTGRDGSTWTMGDFEFDPSCRQWEDDEEDREESESGEPGGELNIYRLTVQFLGHMRRLEGVPYARGELGRRDLHRFILERREGKLEYRESMLASMQRELARQQGRRARPLRKFKSYEHLLVPDPQRLEHYLVGLLDVMNQLYHRAAALFEIIPPWLRFLESRRLIDAEMRVHALAGLEPLAEKLSRVLDTYADDPGPRRALESWHTNACKTVP